MGCLACVRDFHDECATEPCCCSQKSSTPEGLEWTKDDNKVIDPKSTGRKRAAKLFPLDRDKPCEWRGLSLAGGGRVPIIGCTDGNQTNRHHGPNKDTLVNDRANVHLICTTCHNRWHASNDPLYNDNSPDVTPHNPDLLATPEEQLQNEKFWLRNRAKESNGGKHLHD